MPVMAPALKVDRHFTKMAIVGVFLYFCFLDVVVGQALTPPNFNLAVRRQIEATATCGKGVSEPELFCKLTGANPDKDDLIGDFEVIQGQLCDYCDPREPSKTHEAESAVDGTEKWWQSPPLSRGLQYNEVNLTISLAQVFHVAYVFIKMANSPRPGVFVLERSKDYGVTWSPWQYFADTPSDCQTFFGKYGYSNSITKDDSIICTTEYSKVVPLEGGEIVVSLVNNRPSANNFSYSQSLQDWTRATNIRLRLLRTKTLLGHLMAVARQDPTITRRYYYSIKDISIGGRCVCNGHADSCDMNDPRDQTKLVCRCQHNTCGEQCDRCCPGFVQKPWRAATVDAENACEPCQCNGHSTDCRYDEEVARNRSSMDIYGNNEGGGVCVNCQHNTAGINCDKCAAGYYRPFNVPLNSTRVCQRCRCDTSFSTGSCEAGTGRCICRPEYGGVNCDRCNVGYYGYPRCVPCQCHVNGTQGQVCEVGGGQCPCKPNFDGFNCDQCATGYYNFPDCKPCDCDRIGSSGRSCEVKAGQCRCRPNFGGRNCGQCAPGYYNYPACEQCNCDPNGCTADVCDPEQGTCACKPNFSGPRCDRCAAGFYRYPQCIPCGCSQTGLQVNDCDRNGQCVCKPNFTGRTCDQCASGYHHYPQCQSCNCDAYGSYGISCDQETGQCDCQPTFEGLTCNKCRPNYYNYPNCEECSCNPAGAKEVPGYPLGGCGAYSGGQLCECKERVGGRICDTCKPNYWNLRLTNPDGCEDCGCNTGGTIAWSRMCEVTNGQCACRPLVNSRRCDQCVDGTYNLRNQDAFGCQACDCDVGGSQDQNCNKANGACSCKPRVNGRKCNSPIATHYFPTLYHDMHEFEDGHTPTGGAVRYGFDARQFPGYSWRGYAVFSKIQDEVLIDVDVRKPSLYRIIYRYTNPTDRSVNADIAVTPETSSSELPQTSRVVFAPTRQPQFVTASEGSVLTTFVLNPGVWTFALKTPSAVFVDYMVLLPEAYYGATILQQKVIKPCTVPTTSELCRHYVYVDVLSFPNTRCSSGYFDGERTELFDNQPVVEALKTPDMAHINSRQLSLSLDITVTRPAKYVIVLHYHSQIKDKVQDLDVSVQTQSGTVKGTLRLPGCPYSSLCRQPVLDSNGNVKEFTFDSTRATVTISGRSGIDVAADSVTVIPANVWTLDHVTPQFECIRRDGECVPGHFNTPTGTIRVDFESSPNEDRTETDLPPTITDITVKVVKLDRNAPTINVRATVSNPDKYVIVVHYYQPTVVGFNVDVKVTSATNVYTGTLKATYCPSSNGCRAVVQFKDVPDMQTIDLSDQDIRLVFNSTRLVWLDYIAIIPSVQYQSKVLDVQDVDKSAEFISKCGSNDFHINSSTTSFCREAVYSLTTDYNNGAMRCQCNPDGSSSFTCEEFGGQCPCKRNIIGRTCSHCRTGYYGFPNCRQCNCPSGLCDAATGRCMCPPRVTGTNCDICQSQTFGFDALIGCEDCSCDPSGVVNNNLDCDIQTGQCTCKSNVAGRRCNKCNVGYSGFPLCRKCSCDANGVTADVCDQRTGICMCKPNVEGPQCTNCKPSTFFMEERNAKGCTQCFCFGITTRCEHSDLRRSQVNDMSDWAVTNMDNPTIQKKGNTIEAKVESSDVINPDQPIYWIAPAPYRGNKITSYGGQLIYTVRFQLPRGGASMGIIHSDVRIEGNNFTIVHTSTEQPAPGTSVTFEIDLLESKFAHEATGSSVSREQFMTVLSRIDVLHIRASYYSIVTKVSLSDVKLDIASAAGQGDIARNVEMCECPPNYIGTSCEQCAPGFYRSKQGPYLGTCVPCQCNNRADICDPDSGSCNNCRDNFEGPQCLACRVGHYYDDYYRTCKMCACPQANEANNFAYTCEVNRDGSMRQCQCRKGYSGPRCESCEIGYWGNPMIPGGRCQKCACSGNIDIRDPLSCDQSTGQCLRCIPPSAGDNCERCAEWYHGDAVNEKNCQECSCDMTGSEHCDHQSGVCVCKPNVMGLTCDSCAPGHFGFDTGRGCEACDCGAASIGSDCDIITGQCRCRPGVTGRRCDQCDKNFWNYGPRGCQPCQCTGQGAVTCDPRSGVCQCMPGVTGSNCDTCLPRWVMIPNIGCQECDNCVHLLVDDTEILERNVSVMIRDLNSISVGVLAMRRLERINNTVFQLRPVVDRLTGTPTDPSSLDPIKRDLDSVQRLADSVNIKADRVKRESDLLESDSSDVKIRAENLYEEVIRSAINSVNAAVDYVKGILQGGDNVGSANIDELMRQAREMLDEIMRRDFSQKDREANDEKDKAIEALNKAKALLDKAMEQANRTNMLTIRIEEVSVKLVDLRNNSRISLEHSNDALRRNSISRRTITEILEIVKDINIIEKEIEGCHDRSRQLLQDARRFLNDARIAYSQVEEELSRLDSAIKQIEPFVENLERENIRLRPLVDNATEHARKLRQQADLLDSLIADTRTSSEGAVNASNAYQSIIDMINKAMNASLIAIRVADEANELSAGHADEASKSKERSEDLRERAGETIERLNDVIRPRLQQVNITVTTVSTIVIEVRQGVTDINLLLDSLPDKGYGEEARAAADKAMEAQTKAEEAQSKVQTIVDKLPEDQRKVDQIPRDIDSANRNIKDAQSQVTKVQELVPQAIELLNKLRLQADRIRKLGEDLRSNITRLRSDVSIARNHANLLKVGMKFESNSQLWVQNPPNIQQSGSYSKVSLYFRTEQQDGLLVYVGPDVGPRVIDYMALEIIGGKVVFKYDLGSGPAIITSDKIVNDGNWHEVIAERTGKTGKLIVRSHEEENDEQTGVSQGASSILDLNYNSKFFVGGVLDKDIDTLTPDVLTNSRFVGCVADIKFNDVAFGLWNFMEAIQVNGCNDRDILQEQLPREIRFGGNGYVILSKGYFKPTTMSAVRFNFRTFNPDGLMFLMGQGKDYFSVEMKDGKVVARYDLGSGSAMLSSAQNSQQNYNDGKWHSLYVNRNKNDGILKIDEVTVASGRSPGSMTQLEIDNEIYIGGYKGTHNYALVTQKGFEGCIKEVKLGQTTKDINENLEIKDIQQGCSEVARLVSFTHEVANSYIALPSVNIEQNLQMSMTIKSVEKDGLMFYVTDDATQSSGLSISLVGGKIVVMFVANGQRTTLETARDDYNDGRWHYLTITKDPRNLQLDIDDIEILKTKITTREKATTTSLSYIGGVPSSYAVITDNVGSSTSFVGCVSDVNINDNAQNFAEVSPSNMVGAILASCHIADPTPSPRPAPTRITPPVPVVPTGLPPEKCRLPLEPQLPETVASEGIRFGVSPDSRYEYSSLPRNNATGTELKIDFKTTATNGTIFYVASEKSKDFIALYMKDGKIGFAYNCGSGVGRGVTPKQYNDGRWHTVTFARVEKAGTLTVDDDDAVTFISGGRLQTIEVNEPYYLGGLPNGVATVAAKNLEGIKTRFVGCLRNFKQDNVRVGAPVYDTGTEPCHSAAEQGVFFYSDGGHLVLHDNYSVPLDFRLSLEIKPRAMSGVIFSIFNHGTGPPGGDFLVLQLVNGSVVFSMDNGRGERKSEYLPSSKNELCNGQWHTIAALKTKNVVTLEVDGVHTLPGIGIEGVAHTNTRDPVYFGGVPELHRGIKTRDQYVGCIRRLVFNGQPVNLSDTRSVGRVNLSTCPTT